MKIFLAGTSGIEKNYYNKTIQEKHPFILESFYYMKDNIKQNIHNFGDFLLDSGAFTFLNSSKKIKLDEYIEKYCDFIIENKVEKFFELDIDKIIGYEKVKNIRKLIEKKTNKQCIPVWHRQRGKKEFFNLCEEYKYIAIGGIAIKDIQKNEYPIFSYLINEAHKKNCKIHGLGFTNLNGLKKYHFDSVDSTTWSNGLRYGEIHKFDGQTIKRYTTTQMKKKLINKEKVIENNFNEWIKFQKYAEICL